MDYGLGSVSRHFYDERGLFMDFIMYSVLPVTQARHFSAPPDVIFLLQLASRVF